MKTKTLWIDFITHAKKASWKWKPWRVRSQIVFTQDKKTWLAPHLELGWLFLVIHWTGYDYKKESNIKYDEHECPKDLMQERINQLENAIRLHRDEIDLHPVRADLTLWKVL